MILLLSSETQHKLERKKEPLLESPTFRTKKLELNLWVYRYTRNLYLTSSESQHTISSDFNIFVVFFAVANFSVLLSQNKSESEEDCFKYLHTTHPTS